METHPLAPSPKLIGWREEKEAGLAGAGLKHAEKLEGQAPGLRFGDQRCQHEEEVEEGARWVKQGKKGQEAGRVEEWGRDARPHSMILSFGSKGARESRPSRLTTCRVDIAP